MIRAVCGDESEFQALAERLAAADAKTTEFRQDAERASAREAELRKMLIEAHDGLFRRDEEYQAALTAASQNEALQRELAAFRRFAVGTLEVCLATPEGDRLEAFAIDSPTSASQVTAEEIVVNGWVVGRQSAVVAVELLGPTAILKRVPVQIERPDIAAERPQVPWAETSGFRTTISALEMAEASRVELRAILQDGSSVPLGMVRAVRAEGAEVRQGDDLLAAAEAKISELCQGLEEASAREAEWRQKLLRQDQEYQDALTKVSQIESLRRELDTLRQVAIGTLQVSLSTQDGGSLLEGFSIDAPDSRNQVRADELELNGWIVGRTCPAVAVELIGAAGTLKRVPVQIQRPDIAAEHPQVPWAETSGFRTTISALEMAQATRVELRDPTGWQQCPPWDDSCRLRG